MSSVILQVGQCGNQIGEAFWKTVKEEKTEIPGLVYQCGDGYLRSVHVDSEPKVVRRLVANMKGDIREGNVILGKRGRGTNWALGYYGIKGHEDYILSQAVDMVRRESERCDSFAGIIMMHSLSGGTGSGMGSRLCETLRDEFSLSYLMSCVVAPHSSGESPLQHYNSLLCLDFLQRYSDSILLFHNDEVIHQLEKKTMRGRAAVPAISFAHMNEHIAAGLARVFLPINTLTPSSGVSIGIEPWEMLRTVTPMPHLKFANINTLARSMVSWSYLAGLLSQTTKRFSTSSEHYATLASLVVARGGKYGAFDLQQDIVEAKIKSAYNTVKWNPFPVDFWTGLLDHTGLCDSASLTVCANSSSVVDHIDTILTGAREKHSVGAYLHWYWKHGCEQADFDQAFNTLHQVMAEYKEAIL